MKFDLVTNEFQAILDRIVITCLRPNKQGMDLSTRASVCSTNISVLDS